MTEKIAQARAMLASALEVDVADIAPDAAIDTEERWDSLAHMRVILALQEAVGAPLAPEVVVAIASLADIAEVLAQA